MIVDTSAVMTTLFGEKGVERYDEAIAQTPCCRMSGTSRRQLAARPRNMVSECLGV